MYLDEKLTFYEDKIVDEAGGCVMMNWESEWMKRSAEVVSTTKGDILNIGFGLGIVDSFIQTHNPKTHTIVEAHPDIYAKMLKDGWQDKPGVKIIHGRWQDVKDQLSQYDGIYFDTYRDAGFIDQLIPLVKKILKPNGVFSYWEGRYNSYIDPLVTSALVKDFDYSFEILKLKKVPSFKEQTSEGNGYFNEKWDQCVIPIIKHKKNYKKTLL